MTTPILRPLKALWLQILLFATQLRSDHAVDLDKVLPSLLAPLFSLPHAKADITDRELTGFGFVSSVEI